MTYSIIFLFVILIISLFPFKKEQQTDEKFLSFPITNLLRGIAILLVILQHISGYLGTNIFTPGGGTGVAIFLLLSGFGLNESFKKKGLTSFWENRIIKVFIPYILLISVLFITDIKQFHFKQYLYDITGIKTSYWYIGFLLKQYILFYICTKFFLKIRFYMLALFSFIILCTFPNLEAEQAFSFFTGVLISEFYNTIVRKTGNKYLTLSIIFFIIGTISLGIKQVPYIRPYENHFVFSFIQLFIKLPYALFFIWSIHLLKNLHKSKFLNFSGKISYELYLIHIIFFEYINNKVYMAYIILILSYIIAYGYFLINTHISYRLKRFYINNL